MKKMIIYITLTIGRMTAYGQNTDSCQCQLMYGNIFHPTLVTYYHDSLVSFSQAMYPKDSIYKLFSKYPIDSLFKISNYKWYEYNQNYSFTKEGIGNKIHGDFYPFHQFGLLDTGQNFNTYSIGYYGLYSDTVLWKVAYKIESNRKINGIQCNCFESERYMYNRNYRNLSLSRQSLENIKTTDAMVDSNESFVWADACEMGVISKCVLPGVGVVSMNMMDPQAYSDDYKLPIVILDFRCKSFFKNRLHLDILEQK